MCHSLSPVLHRTFLLKATKMELNKAKSACYLTSFDIIIIIADMKPVWPPVKLKLWTYAGHTASVKSRNTFGLQEVSFISLFERRRLSGVGVTCSDDGLWSYLSAILTSIHTHLHSTYLFDAILICFCYIHLPRYYHFLFTSWVSLVVFEFLPHSSDKF